MPSEISERVENVQGVVSVGVGHPARKTLQVDGPAGGPQHEEELDSQFFFDLPSDAICSSEQGILHWV
jgi:hypothetical protein